MELNVSPQLAVAIKKKSRLNSNHFKRISTEYGNENFTSIGSRY